MNNTKAESYEAEKEATKSKEFPLVDSPADRSVPWPENPNGAG